MPSTSTFAFDFEPPSKESGKGQATADTSDPTTATSPSYESASDKTTETTGSSAGNKFLFKSDSELWETAKVFFMNEKKDKLFWEKNSERLRKDYKSKSREAFRHRPSLRRNKGPGKKSTSPENLPSSTPN